MASPSSSLRTLVQAPRTAWRRRRYRSIGPEGRALLETHHYRRSMVEFMEAVHDQPELLHEADIDERATVLDVGAYRGEWSQPVAERYHPTIYAFEPNARARTVFEEQLRSVPRVQLFPYGLGGNDRTATLGLAGPGSSVHGESAAFGTAEVQIRDVVAVLDELQLDHVDLMKVNIEGSEYELFDRLIESEWLPRIRLVSVQFHDFVPHAHRRRRAIRRELARSHTEAWNYPWVWEYWTRRS